MSSRLLRKKLQICSLVVLELLFILSNLSSDGIGANQVTHQKVRLGNTGIPTPASTTSSNSSNISKLRSFIDTWSNIHTFLTFDYDLSTPTIIAKHYDFVWGAEMDHAAAFRLGNPNIFLSYYIPFHRDAVANHHLAYWKSFHPDWILYKCDRVTPAYEFGDPNIPLDFANPALVSWQIQTYALPASTKGYDGIAADNVNLENLFGACGVYKQGKWLQRYTGHIHDPQWNTDVIAWLARMQQALHNLPHPLALIPNFSLNNLSASNAQVQQLISHVDGVLDEGGFTTYGKGYVTDSPWIQLIQFIESVQKQHKAYYIIDLFPTIGRAEVQWAIASYLMCKERSAALFISTLQKYGSDDWLSEYTALMGSPTDSIYRAQDVYWRDYNHGLSLVNPSAIATHTITITGHHYIDLYGNPIGPALVIPPHSGLVLLTVP